MARTSLSAAQRAPHGAKHILSIGTLSRKNAGYHGAIFIFAITDQGGLLRAPRTAIGRRGLETSRSKIDFWKTQRLAAVDQYLF